MTTRRERWVIGALLGVLAAATPEAVANGNDKGKGKRQIPAGAIGLAHDVRAQAEGHDWKALLDRCDPEHRKTQKDMGMGEAQYIAEMLGLHSSGNSIKRGTSLTYKDLDRIRKVTIAKLRWRGPWIEATGTVKLAGGKTLRLVMSIHQRESRFYLIGAVG